MTVLRLHPQIEDHRAEPATWQRVPITVSTNDSHVGWCTRRDPSRAALVLERTDVVPGPSRTRNCIEVYGDAGDGKA